MSNIYEDLFTLIAEANNPMTEQGKYFIGQVNDSITLFCYLYQFAKDLDSFATMTYRFAERLGPQAFSSRFGHSIEDLNFISEDHRTKYVRDQSPIMLEMIFCRMVDNFLTYFSEIIKLILLTKPEILKSSEKIQIDYVLDFSTLDELIQDLIDKKIIDLGYKGFVKLNEWCKDRIGVSITTDPTEHQDIIEVIETRNILVHNRGQVGQKYLTHVKNSPFEKGDQRELDNPYIVSTYKLLFHLVKEFDQVVVAKYMLSTS